MISEATRLMRAAVVRMATGDLAGARACLQDAAACWAAVDNRIEQSRCLRLAAALARHEQLDDEAATSLTAWHDRRVLGPGGLAASRVDARSVAGAVLDRPGDGAAREQEASATAALRAAEQAADRGDLDNARTHLHRARAAALAGRAAAAYIRAAVAMSEVAQAAGDPVGAYESLAVGWLTLRDLVGTQAARAAFEPHLLALRERLGPAGFAAVERACAARLPTR